VDAQKSDFFYRVEDNVDLVLKYFGKEGCTHFSDTMANTFQRSTTERFTIDKIKSKEICGELLSLGRKYGYAMRSEYLLI
jgi:hypothetical protein